LSHGDTDTANNYLDGQCGGGAYVRQGYDFYSIYGCTVAYMCNNGLGMDCYASQRQRDSALITAACGWYAPGYDSEWSDGSVYGCYYGYEDFCSS
jgi:hypothetical protein